MNTPLIRFVAVVIFAQVALALLKAETRPPQQGGQSDPASPARFIGRTIEDVEGELGQPFRPPDKLENGNLWYLFRDRSAWQKALESKKSATFLDGWVMIVEKGRVVNAKPNYGQIPPQPNATPSEWQTTKCLAQFVSVTTTPDDSAQPILLLGKTTQSYFFGKSALRCKAGIEGIRLQWSTDDQPQLIIGIRLSKQDAEPLRQFSSQAQGQVIAVLLDDQPIAVALLMRGILEIGEFNMNMADSPDLTAALDKLGLKLPPRDQVKP
jgi:hypothetical protein